MGNEEKFEDEINLIDYLNVILKRKLLIFLTFVLTMIAVGIFSFVSPKIYRVETILEIGEVGGEDEKILFIEDHTQIIEKIEMGIYQHKLPGQEFVKVEASNPKDTNLIIIKSESRNPEQVKKVLQEINNLILLNHQEQIRNKKELFKGDIERLRIKIISLEEEKEILRAQIGVLEKIPIQKQTLAEQFTLFSIKERLEHRKREIENLYLGINSYEKLLGDIQPTKVIKAPLIPEAPIKPRPVLNISIAGILGLFVGTFLAFSKEWWEKSKRC